MAGRKIPIFEHKSSAQQVSVSLLPLMKAATVSFHWTIENFRQCTSYSSKNLSYTNDSFLKMPEWYVYIKLTVKEGYKIVLDISPSAVNGVILNKCRVAVITRNKELMQIYKCEGRINRVENYETAITKALLMCEENGFLTDDKLTLVISVDCILVNNDNEVPSSSGVLQDSPSHLRSGFTQLYESKQCSDVTLNVGDLTIKAHKAILIASSPVFTAMFQHTMQEEILNSVSITDIDPNVLEEMLRYIYTGTTPKLNEMAENLLKAADKYALPNLKLKCEKSLQVNISIENAAGILMLADRYNAQDLKKKTLEYITANAKCIIETQGWQEMIEVGSNSHLLAEAFRAMALNK